MNQTIAINFILKFLYKIELEHLCEGFNVNIQVNDYLYCLATSQMANINFETNEIRSYEALDDVLY